MRYCVDCGKEISGIKRCSKCHCSKLNSTVAKKTQFQKGINHWNYKNGKKLNLRGNKKTTAIMIKINGKYRAEHRVVMEKHIGRKLKKTELVHHLDGNAMNNDIKNLKIVTQSEHNRIHRLGWRKN